jgi:hypothetical protein
MKNITDLVLEFPGIHRLPPNILSGLHFEKLIAFKSNLRHNIVADFLENHPRIECLTIGFCRGGPCSLPGVLVPSLRYLSCPLNCIPATRSLVQLTATHGNARDVRLQAPQIIRFSSKAMTVLHLDFNPNETGLLKTLAIAVPNIQYLKLSEKGSKASVSQVN